jgi:MFS family permease
VTFDRWLVMLCLARSCASLMFMSYAGTLSVLRDTWGMSATAAGSISAAFQLGYAVSLVICSALAGRFGARRVFQSSMVASALAAVAFAAFARSYVSGLTLYTLVAVSQGGLYTTAIMLISQRYAPERRGAAVGWLIGSSSLGYAASLMLCGVMLAHTGYIGAFLMTAAGPVLGALLAWPTLRSTANVVHPADERLHFSIGVLRNRPAMRLIVGYTGHNWELLGMWAWTPAFVAASFAASGAGFIESAELGAYSAASFHAVGLLASSSMGWLSDKLGSRRLLLVLAGVSTACSFTFGWLLGVPGQIVLVVGAVYAFTGLGDSPILSATLTHAVRPSSLGSALALRSLLGFGAGAVAPLVFGAVLDRMHWADAAGAWGPAFMVLGLGGLIAVWSATGVARHTPSAAA